MRKTKQALARLSAAALAITAAAWALPLPAHAQFFGDRWGWGGERTYQRPAPGPRSFFSFPFFNRPSSPANPPLESYRAPPPRKPETPPTTTVAVIGDSMADWLAYGLEEVYGEQPQIGIVRNIRPNSGLVHYDPRNDTLEWSQAVKDVLATEKPSAIIVMLGLNDRVPLHVTAPAPTPPVAPARDGKQPASAPGQTATSPQPSQAAKPPLPPDTEQQKPDEAPPERNEASTEAQHPAAAGTYDFHTDEWAKLYAKRIDEMIAALKSKGVPVIWVGLPALRGPKATGDMSYLDDLYRTEADKAGIIYVDIWDGFVDENGRYSVEGPDFEGQIRRLRTGDGVHFTKFGALKLAHLVDQELSRILAHPAAPAVLTSPEASAPAKPGAVRPAVGPVLPLTAAGGAPGTPLNSETGDLLGSGNHAAPTGSEDPTAASVLMQGEALSAPAGRADDFTWPPREASAEATPPTAQAKPAPAAVQATPAPGATKTKPVPSAAAPVQAH